MQNKNISNSKSFSKVLKDTIIAWLGREHKYQLEGPFLRSSKGLMISANTGSNFGMCSSSGGFNACGFFFGLVFTEESLLR